MHEISFTIHPTGYNVRYIIQNYTLLGTIRNIIPRVLLVVSVPPYVTADELLYGRGCEGGLLQPTPARVELGGTPREKP